MVATGDKAAGADVVRSMAKRAGAEITEVEGSHVIMISQPQVVTDTIMKALQTVAEPSPSGSPPGPKVPAVTPRPALPTRQRR